MERGETAADRDRARNCVPAPGPRSRRRGLVFYFTARRP